MKKILSLIISLSLTGSIFAPSVFSVATEQIYVSLSGSEGADGTAENPVNSIEAAMQLAKKYNGQNIEILFKEGRYEFKKTVSFSADNTASDGCSIVYKPDKGAEVVFTGAKRLLPEDFKTVSDVKVLRKTPSTARGKLLMIELSEYGLDYSSSDSVRPYLYVNNKLQTTARYPNEGLLKATQAKGTSSFVYEDYDISKWSSATDAVLSGSTLSTYYWRNLDMSASGNTITVDGTVRENAEFYVENLIEELDMPGEYYVDRNEDILYYYPTEDFGESTVIEITSFFDTAVRMDSCSGITFDNLTFEKLGGRAFYITNVDNVTIKNCTMNFVQGGDAIYLKGYNSQISDNSFYGCANNAIEIHGGAVSTLTPGNIKVSNNRISNCGYYGRHSVIYSGIDSTAMPSDYGNEISNNLIQDCMTFMGIVCNANDTKILCNEIVNPGWYIGDGGAIYMGKSNVKYGMEVAYNYIHNGHKGDSSYAYCGLYSDDGYSGNNYHHNVVRDMYQSIIIGAGMNSEFNNNLFIGNSMPPHILSRMTYYSSSNGATESGYQSMMYNEANTIKEKAVYKDEFFEKYPLIDEALKRKPYFAPWNTEFTGNIRIGDGGDISRPWHPYYKKDGTVVIEGEDALIAENTAALKKGSQYVGSTLFKGDYVDELALYGAKIKGSNGKELNGTVEGNPSYAYNETYFKDADRQNYSLSSNLASDVSTAYEIDMDKIGIISTSNSNTFTLPQKPTAIYPADKSVCSSETVLSWERVKNASYYVITVSENETLENPVAELTVYESSMNLAKAVSLKPDTEYYWNITAYGLAKSDIFETVSKTYSFSTLPEGSVNSESSEYILSLLDAQLEKYEAGEIEYTDAKIYPELKELSEKAHSLTADVSGEEELCAIENEILEAMALYGESIVYMSAEITECVADSESDDVNVKAKGFKADSLVSITVTNPEYDLKAVSGAFSLDGVQYTDTVKADSDGEVEFTFNTRVKNEDRSGIYTVHMAGENGNVISKSYCYGIISASEVIYTNANGEKIMDLAKHKNETVTMSCKIWNGTGESFNPAVVTAFYSEHGNLCGVNVADTTAIAANKSEEIKWNVKIEESASARIMFLHSLSSLRPFEKCRVIYEISAETEI